MSRSRKHNRSRKQNGNRKQNKPQEQKKSRNQTWNNFFLQTFSEPDAARDLARNIIPGQYQPFLQDARLTVEPGTWIDQELREYRTDLLLKCTGEARNRIPAANKKPGSTGSAGSAERAENAGHQEDFYIYILFDHKSNPDRWTVFQLLSYMMNIWADLRKRGKTPDKETYLPEIVPVIFYHGMRKWSCPKRFQDLVRGQVLNTAKGLDSTVEPAEHQVKYTPLFFNLQEKQDKELRGGVRAMTGLLFLKYLVRRLDRDSAVILLEALHEHPATTKLKEFFRSCYQAIAEKQGNKAVSYHGKRIPLYRCGGRIYDPRAGITDRRQKGRQKGRESGSKTGRPHPPAYPEVLVRK